MNGVKSGGSGSDCSDFFGLGLIGLSIALWGVLCWVALSGDTIWCVVLWCLFCRVVPCCASLCCFDTVWFGSVNPRRIEGMRSRGEGGGVIGPPFLYFQSIQPIDMKLACVISVQYTSKISILTWHLISFHGNHSNTMMSLVAARHLGFSSFQIFFIFKFKHWKQWENNI